MKEGLQASLHIVLLKHLLSDVLVSDSTKIIRTLKESNTNFTIIYFLHAALEIHLGSRQLPRVLLR